MEIVEVAVSGLKTAAEKRAMNAKPRIKSHPSKFASIVVAFLIVPCVGCGTTDPLTGGSAVVPTTLRLPGGDVTVATTVNADGLMFADVFVNGTGPYKFLIDTGAGATVISPRITALFPASIGGTTNTSSGAIAGTVARRLFQVDSITLGSVSFENFQAVEIDVAPILPNSGFTVEGVLGLPLFRAIALTLDFPRSRVRLRNGQLPAIDDCNVFGLTVDSAELVNFPLTVEGQRVQALLDSGNNSFLFLPTSFDKVSFVGPTTTSTASTVTGSFNVTNGCLAPGAVSFGCFSFSDPCVGIGGSDIINFGVDAMGPFRMTIDQPSRRVAFEQ
jgi:predicted aspartyl protease